jgi:hypothetical protein
VNQPVKDTIGQPGITYLFVPHVGSRAFAIALDYRRVWEYVCD